MTASGDPPLIEAGHGFDGVLCFQGAARVDGSFRGEIIASGTLRLGESARVQADVEIDEVVIAGRLEGDVRARRRIELLPTARVTGNVEAPRIAMAAGSVLKGYCRTGPRASRGGGPTSRAGPATG